MQHFQKANLYVQELAKSVTPAVMQEKLSPKFTEAAKLPRFIYISKKAVEERWKIAANPLAQAELLDDKTNQDKEKYQKNIENFVGTVKLPVGLAGPLRVNGLFAQGDYYVPLATTEAALVASYSRGAQLITAAGGCATALLTEGVCRSPGFVFKTIVESGLFVNWVLANLEHLKTASELTTRHGKFMDVGVAIEGNHVYLRFDYLSGDASGQNMVTIATEAACRYILEHSPVKPEKYYIEANFSGDKKASALSFLGVRGKKVTSEIYLSPDLLKKFLRTTPQEMADYWRISAVGGVLSGTVGVQGHYANGLAALYIACGQDAACASESSVGVTRMEVADDGSLYVAVTLPNIIVGTVGGGTALPSQRACLDIMGLSGEGNARKLAEVVSALMLAGELSIIGAIVAGDFTRAHQSLARGK